MKLVANNQRMYIGAWLMAALVLVGVNLSTLSQIELQSLGESPIVVNQLRLRLLQFDELLSMRRMDSETRLDPPIMLTHFPKAATLQLPHPAISTDEIKTLPRTPSLPQLSGILQVIHGTGAGHFSAVLDGKVYVEKDNVDGFRIEEISSRGVSLRQRDQRWFIPAPEVYYSIGQRP